jgi:hypothetical protein
MQRVNEDDLPDFLAVNGFRLPRGMFGTRYPASAGGTPFPVLASNPVDPFANALAPLIGPSAPPASIFSDLAVSPPTPQPGTSVCPLVPLVPKPGAIVPSRTANLRFSPAFADVLRKAADTLNRQGIPLKINEGFRTAVEQARMRNGGSGTNPAARYSDHQLGNAVDIDGTRLSSFPQVKQAFLDAGAKWGGDYRRKKDPPHFYVRPTPANAANTAECERENPR